MGKLIFGRLSPVSRAFLLGASGLLLLHLVFPLWQISLVAPQYPEGLSLQIWAGKLTGDLQTINILNHYIGMASIQEESFPELKIFPVIFLALSGFACAAALIGRRWAATLFSLSALGFSVWSMIDFYRWEYKFGHELSPDAAIKMEDMVYQPPLIGEKLFLNISASSWPAGAGLAFAVAVAFSILVVAYELYRKEPGSGGSH